VDARADLKFKSLFPEGEQHGHLGVGSRPWKTWPIKLDGGASRQQLERSISLLVKEMIVTEAHGPVKQKKALLTIFS